MNWINLTDVNQLQELIEHSNANPQVIFKHSTRCNVSSIAMQRLKGSKDSTSLNLYYLDLLQFRSLSNKVAEIFNEHHESPQILIIKNGECVYTESHLGITVKELLEQTIAA